MKQKFYAVRRGLQTGVFHTWEACKEQVSGYSGAEYKSFATLQEAEAYLQGEQKITQSFPENGRADIYVDGSYQPETGEFSYGMVVLREGGTYCFSGKCQDMELAKMRNVAGEIQGAQAAMAYALQEGLSAITIYHDYEGIAKWCTGAWKTKKEGTKAYKEFYDKVNEKVTIEFKKVTGHSGDTYNELADQLAKDALGISEP